MKVYVSYSVIGVFGYDGNEQLVDFSLFPKDIKKAAESITICASTLLSNEEKKLVDKLKTKYEIIFEQRKEGFEHEFPNIAGKVLRRNLRNIAMEGEAVNSVQEFNELVYSVNFELTKRGVRKSTTPDKLIIQAVNTMDELDKTVNQLSVRLREWYGLYFPELSDKISSHEKFVKLVFTGDTVKEDSIGGELEENDLKTIRKLAESINELYKEREDLEKYIASKTKDVMPNTHALAGPLLTAKLLSLAGGLEKLSKFPSSTIQVLGAEKSLFRFLHGKGTPPKFGVLFSHPYIQKAHKNKMGKVSRILASKISLAVRMDYYGKKDCGEALKNELDKKIKKVLKEN